MHTMTQFLSSFDKSIQDQINKMEDRGFAVRLITVSAHGVWVVFDPPTDEQEEHWLDSGHKDDRVPQAEVERVAAELITGNAEQFLKMFKKRTLSRKNLERLRAVGITLEEEGDTFGARLQAFVEDQYTLRQAAFGGHKYDKGSRHWNIDQ